MFQGFKTIWNFLKAMNGTDKTFSVMVVPNDGGEMTSHSFDGNKVRGVLHGVAVLATLLAFSVGAMYYVLYTGWTDRDELKKFYAVKDVQEQRIGDLQTLTDDVQKELADLQKFKRDVLEEMKRAGMELPALSDDKERRNGKGGPVFGLGDKLTAKIKILEEQNNNLAYNLEIDKQDINKLLKVIKQDNYRKEVTPDMWPVDNGFVTSEFGRRQNPVTGEWGDFHPGLDIAADYGQPIYATASGRVTHSGWYTGYGKYVEIEHDFGYATAYGHMSSINVNVGAYVVKGQMIGRIGSTGYSTGPHLHYEVILWGEQVNPKRYIK